MIDYNKRLVEVDEILKYLSKDNYNKKPEEITTTTKENKDPNYIWKYDESKKLKEQNVNDDTIAILCYINTAYLLNDDQKKFVESLYQKVNNLEHNNNYSNQYIDIFAKNKVTAENEIPKEQQELTTCRENILKKIINKIRNIFKR